LKDDDENKCKSRIWWEKIKSLAAEFEKRINKKSNKDEVFIQLDTKKLEEAFEMYECGWYTFKEHVYGEKADENRIDRHKIIALYILSFLTKRPFSVSFHPENKEVNKNFFLANELFSFVVMRALLAAWNENKFFEINDKEKKWLMILFNLFKLKFIKSNPPKISDDPSSMTDFLSLAQIVYYIEKFYTYQPSLTNPTQNTNPPTTSQTPHKP